MFRFTLHRYWMHWLYYFLAACLMLMLPPCMFHRQSLSYLYHREATTTLLDSPGNLNYKIKRFCYLKHYLLTTKWYNNAQLLSMLVFTQCISSQTFGSHVTSSKKFKIKVCYLSNKFWPFFLRNSLFLLPSE